MTRKLVLVLALGILVVSAAKTAKAQSALDVDTTNGNSPYSASSVASYTTITVGDTSTGILNDTAKISPSGIVTIGNTATGVGTFNLESGGTLSAATTVDVGLSGDGTFNMTGGSFTIGTANHSMVLGANSGSAGTLLLSGGTADMLSLFAGSLSTGVASVSGGTLITAGSDSIGYENTGIGTLNVSGGTINVAVNLYVSYGGTGTVNLTGGTLNVAGNVDLAHGSSAGSGTLIVSTGAEVNTTATGSQFNVGDLGHGYVVQSGGSINLAGTTPVAVGLQASATGTITISGGTLNASGCGVYVGDVGSGTVTQSGGTFNAGGTGVTIAVGSAATGTYKLSAGTLLTGTVTGGAGASSLNLNGGTLELVGTTGTVSSLTTANVQAGGAIFNANSGSLTVSQPLVHDTTSGAPAVDGGLSFYGPGTLILTGNNTYTGGSIISNGTVRANNATSSLGIGSVTLSNGGTLGGDGTITNGTNQIFVASGTTITAGVDSSTVGTLSTGNQTWETSGTFLAKISPSAATNDRLVLTGVTVQSSFIVNATESAYTASQYVIAVDTGVNYATTPDPFKLSSLTLKINGGTAPSYARLLEESDVLGIGGVDLYLSVPEPTTMGLLALGSIGLLSQRRRVKKTGQPWLRLNPSPT